MLSARLIHIGSVISEGGLSWGTFSRFVLGLSKLFFPLIVIVFSMLWVGDPAKDPRLVDRRKALALVFLAPLPHWVYGGWVSAERHVTPVLACAFASFLWRLGTTADFGWNPLGERSPRFIFLVVLALMGSFVLPSTRRSTLCLLRGEPFGGPRSVATFIKTVNGLPKERSVAIWCDMAAVGPVSCRKDLWLFPLRAESVDYVVIQKKANSTWRAPASSTVWASPPPGTNGLAFQEIVFMRDGDIAEVKRWLVGPPGEYDVEREDKELLVLRRRYPFVMRRTLTSQRPFHLQRKVIA